MYVSYKDDKAELNQLLRGQRDSLKIEVEECEERLILDGKLPVPEGYSIVAGRVMNDEIQAYLARAAINVNLIRLTNPQALARSETDAKYDKKRKEDLKEWLAVERQEGFPYKIDWPEIP